MSDKALTYSYRLDRRERENPDACNYYEERALRAIGDKIVSTIGTGRKVVVEIERQEHDTNHRGPYDVGRPDLEVEFRILLTAVQIRHVTYSQVSLTSHRLPPPKPSRWSRLKSWWKNEWAEIYSDMGYPKEPAP